MFQCEIDKNLIMNLREFRASTPQAVANDLFKFNKIAQLDSEMAIVRARRVIDLIIRNIATIYGNIPGTKPLDQLINELNRTNEIPQIIQKHCRVVKDFGNIAAHGIEETTPCIKEESITQLEVGICATSLMAVVRWYLDHIVPKLSEKTPYRVVSGKQVTNDMIDQAVAIDQLIYPNQLRGIRENCYAWHDRNPDIYTMLLDGNTGSVIGYINAMPLEEEHYKLIESGQTIDVDITPNMIRRYDFPDFYLLYFSSIGLHPSYHDTSSFRTIYASFIDSLLNLAREEIFMTEILADAVSLEGARLCKYAGMRDICKTSHDSIIYKATMLPPSLRVTTSSGKNLVLYYQKKYDEFRDLL